MLLLAYIAAITETIELVPSVVVLPARQTVLFAKQATELDVLAGGRVRLGIGVGGNEAEYRALGASFHDRGRRCSEQMQLLKALWCRESVSFSGSYHEIEDTGLNPLPVQRPIPMWIGASSRPAGSVRDRIARLSDGWFVLCDPEEYGALHGDICRRAGAAGRDPDELGREAGVAVVGPREAEWKDRVAGWHRTGLTHLCLRTLGGGLAVREHLTRLEQTVHELPDEVRPQVPR